MNDTREQDARSYQDLLSQRRSQMVESSRLVLPPQECCVSPFGTGKTSTTAQMFKSLFCGFEGEEVFDELNTEAD